MWRYGLTADGFFGCLYKNEVLVFRQHQMQDDLQIYLFIKSAGDRQTKNLEYEAFVRKHQGTKHDALA